MRGKHKAKKRDLRPDEKYQSVLVMKLIDKILLHGQKTTATNIVYDSFTILEEKTKKPALESFEQVIKNVRPILEVRSKRIGGATYQVPVEVSQDRGETLSLRWIVNAARGKKGSSMAKKLSEELVAAYNKEGAAMKKRENVHKMAEANKAFAHFARF